ncbi:hypothetical protein [Pedobacter chinensis]|uniref:hypothetical protein n=1 Tax=Pedobacter chinensis TaxID=2282421 RepID=UPI001F15BF8B|nr:hypothetical protein [Pedobacter chinensis]
MVSLSLILELTESATELRPYPVLGVIHLFSTLVTEKRAVVLSVPPSILTELVNVCPVLKKLFTPLV